MSTMVSDISDHVQIHTDNFFASIKQVGEQANKQSGSSFPFSDFLIFSSLLGCCFSGISCTFLYFSFCQMSTGFLASTVPLIFT